VDGVFVEDNWLKTGHYDSCPYNAARALLPAPPKEASWPNAKIVHGAFMCGKCGAHGIVVDSPGYCRECWDAMKAAPK